MILQPIETERLCIRQFEANDCSALYAYASDPVTMTYIPDGPLTQNGAKEFIEKHQGEQAEWFSLILKGEGTLIGQMLFHPWFAPRTYEVGWVVNPAYQGNGYATEAAYALLKHSFETLKAHRVIATCQPENPASYRVMEKLGMRREGHFQKCVYQGDDLWWDEYFYAMLGTEFK